MVQFEGSLDRRLREAAEAAGKWPRDLIYEAVRRYLDEEYPATPGQIPGQS
jgi:hypothetical protein